MNDNDNKVIAINQKNYNKLFCSNDTYNKIIDNETNIVIFGSNGQGKSTFKELLTKENCEKNFNNEDSNQLNLLYNEFKDRNIEVFDDDYTNKFIYKDDEINSNHLKVILKTDLIDNALKDKQDQLINLKELSNKIKDQLKLLEDTIAKYNYKLDKPTPTQQRFADTIFKGNKTDLDFKDIKTFSYSWWVKGYQDYKSNENHICPWCNNKYEDFNPSIKNILSKEINLDNAKVEKIINDKENLTIFLNEQKLKGLKPTIDKRINIILDLLKESAITNNKKELKDNYVEVLKAVYNDLNIFKELYEQIKYLNNLTELEDFTIMYNFKELKYLKLNDDIKEIQERIDLINDKSKYLSTVLKENNEKLLDIIEPSKDLINSTLTEFGFDLQFDIAKENILQNNQINDESEYVVVKNSNGKDLTKLLGKVLSYGEHNTLAFAIFLASLEKKSEEEKAKTVVVFDDPISSYDIYRRSITIMRIKKLIDKGLKKIFIFTHENSFVVSLYNALKPYPAKYLNLNFNGDSDNKYLKELTREEIFGSEIKFYVNQILSTNNYVHLMLALRKLTDFIMDLRRRPEGEPPKDLFGYLSIILHYRKTDEHFDIDKVKEQLVNILKIYNIKKEDINLNIEGIFDRNKMFNFIDQYFEEVRNKDIYEIYLEDVLCFRVFAEKAIRDEVYRKKQSLTVYKREHDCWKIKNSDIKEKLEYYSSYLNSICHIDTEDANDSTFSLFDYRYIPTYIKKSILDIIYERNI